jgi:hypothetical protein
MVIKGTNVVDTILYSPFNIKLLYLKKVFERYFYIWFGILTKKAKKHRPITIYIHPIAIFLKFYTGFKVHLIEVTISHITKNVFKRRTL